MRRVAWLLAVTLVAALLPLVAAASAPAPTVHPRLLFSAEELPALRERVATEEVPAAAWARLREKAEGHLLKVHPAAIRLGVRYDLQNEMPTYLIELGLAYQLSGDARYGRRVVDVILALGDAGYPFWSGQDLGIGDLLEGIGLGFDWTYELMTPAERAEIVGDLTANEYLFDRALLNPTNAFASNNPKSNWMGVTSGGAGLTLLAIRGEPGVPVRYDTYLDAALDRTRRFFVASVDPQGANEEGLTYAVYGLKNSVPFALAARREGLGDLMAGTGLPLLARWAAFEQLPGEGPNFVPLNDSQRGLSGVDFQAQMFAIDPDNGVAQWLWNRTVGPLGTDFYREPHVPEVVREDKCRDPVDQPVSLAACDFFNFHGNVWTILHYRTPEETPEVDPATVGPLALHHAERGLVDVRTGFDGEVNEVVSTFEARRDGRGHYHYDLGGFTLYGEGGRWAIDPGYSCIACRPPPEDPIQRAQDEDGAYAIAHNVVLVDGSRFTQLHNSRFNVGDGQTIDSFVDAPNLTLTHADLRYAYDFQAPYAGRDHFVSRVPGRPVLLGITDHLQRDASGSHTYTWQMLTDDRNLIRLDGTGFTIIAPNGAVLTGRTAAGGSSATDPTVQLRIQPLLNPTDDFGSLAPVVSTTTPSQPTYDHLAVMALTPPGEQAATTEIVRVEGGNAVAVTWAGVTDVIVRKLAAATTVTGPVATDAGFAKFTRDGGETVLRGGTLLAADGRDYVHVTGTAATVTVSGDAAQATGEDANIYRVYAPQAISTVTVNGAPAASCRDGEHLVFPCGG